MPILQVIVQVVQVIALIAIAILLATRRLVGPPGAPGRDGRDGAPGPVGPPGPVSSLPTPTTLTKQVSPSSNVRHKRYEMLNRIIRDGQVSYLKTGHFVDEGQRDHQEIWDTPGLSLLGEDGTIIDGRQ